MTKKIDPANTKSRSKSTKKPASTSGRIATLPKFADTGEEDELVRITTRPRMTRNILRRLGEYTNKIISNPDKINLNTYKNMYETDETIQSGIEFISLSAMSMLGPFSHEDPDIEKAVQLAIENLSDGWLQFWDELITDGCIYGFANAEVCMTTDSEDGSVDKLKTELDAIVGVNPLSGKFQYNLDRKSEHYGDIEGFVQWPDTEYAKLIPAAKLITWSHKKRHGNAYGTSRLKCIWKNWVIKDQMLKAWALAMDRSGSPITWIACEGGDQMIEDPLTGDSIKKGEYLQDMIDDIENVTGFVLGKDDKVGNIQVPRSVGADFKIIEDHMNGMMFRGMLIPILLLDTSDIGSNALAQQHFKVYVMSMSKLMQMIIPVVIRSAIRPFIIANFGKQKSYGNFAVKQLAEESMKVLADIYYGLTQNGYMSPKNENDMRTIRENLNVPQMSSDEYKKFLEEKKKEEEAAKQPASPLDPKTGKPIKVLPGGKSGQPVGGRKGNPSSPQPEKPGTRPASKAPSKKQGRPKAS